MSTPIRNENLPFDPRLARSRISLSGGRLQTKPRGLEEGPRTRCPARSTSSARRLSVAIYRWSVIATIISSTIKVIVIIILIVVVVVMLC